MANNQSGIAPRLWASADVLRANSKLKSSEYSAPVLGLNVCRYAHHRFARAEKEVLAQFAKKNGRAARRAIVKGINKALKAVEVENEDLKSMLPKPQEATP